MKLFANENLTEDFKVCYEKYYTVVFKHAAYLTGSIQLAEDIAQESFIKLYHSPPPDQSNVGAWLSRVATNLAYNHMRGEKIRKSKEPVIDEYDTDKVISIEDAVIRNSEIRLTKKVLNTLNARDRMCLLLKFSGYKYNEIAEIVGIEKTSVGQTLVRAQAKFKERYQKEVRY